MTDQQQQEWLEAFQECVYKSACYEMSELENPTPEQWVISDIYDWLAYKAEDAWLETEYGVTYLVGITTHPIPISAGTAYDPTFSEWYQCKELAPYEVACDIFQAAEVGQI